ncbi:MAG: YqgE/AlgH family protein [Candidatus Sulfotelmatobacter sp.]
MSLARLGFFVVLATIVAHAPQVANNLDVANRVEASYAKSQISPAIPLPVQSKNPDLLGVGKILVASRSLGDPHFAQTVILLVQYDAGGVVGLILNRRTELPVSRVLGDYQAAKDRSDPVYFGGPVDSQQVRALRKSPAKLDGAMQICHGVYQIATKAQLEQALTDQAAPKAFHVYLGYAGWHADQLRKEMELGAWFVFPGDSETVFHPDPDFLWPQMIRKTELQMARNAPVDAN